MPRQLNHTCQNGGCNPLDSVLLAAFKDQQQLRLLSWPNGLTSLSKELNEMKEGRPSEPSL